MLLTGNESAQTTAMQFRAHRKILERTLVAIMMPMLQAGAYDDGDDVDDDHDDLP